jgi:hypothetical protein
MGQEMGEPVHKLLDPFVPPMFGQRLKFTLIKPDPLTPRTLVYRDLMDLTRGKPLATPGTAQVNEFAKELFVFVRLFFPEPFYEFTVTLGKKPIFFRPFFFVKELSKSIFLIHGSFSSEDVCFAVSMPSPAPA